MKKESLIKVTAGVEYWDPLADDAGFGREVPKDK